MKLFPVLLLHTIVLLIPGFSSIFDLTHNHNNNYARVKMLSNNG